MKYEFRTRAILGTTVKIESQQTELEVFDSGGVRVVVIAAARFIRPFNRK